jgi:hypothetical protein
MTGVGRPIDRLLGRKAEKRARIDYGASGGETRGEGRLRARDALGGNVGVFRPALAGWAGIRVGSGVTLRYARTREEITGDVGGRNCVKL